jgi:hypothetical protein
VAVASGTPFALGLLLATVVACGPDADRETAATEPAETENAPVTSVAPSTTRPPDSTTTDLSETTTSTPRASVPEARDWSADLVGGGRIDMAELGERPILLWFWAPY